MLLTMLYQYIDIGDACDDDIDNDGIPNEKDNCIMVPNPDQKVAEGTEPEQGQACFNDFDGDGVKDKYDVCPKNALITTTSFGELRTMDLCATMDIKKNGGFFMETYN